MALISAGNTVVDAGSLNLMDYELISTVTASNSGRLEFTSGITSTYDKYIFEFNNIHPVTDDVDWVFAVSTDGGSNYDLSKTQAGVQLQGDEAGGAFQNAHQSLMNAAEQTGNIRLAHSLGNDADSNLNGHFMLYNPSNTTFMKSYISHIQSHHHTNIAMLHTVSGYVNSTNDVDAIKFLFTSGNIESGTIKMYGVRGS